MLSRLNCNPIRSREARQAWSALVAFDVALTLHGLDDMMQSLAAPRLTTKRIPRPEPVAKIYAAIADLERLYPKRKFTLDGHLAGSIGEVIAAEALDLKLYPMSQPGHDAHDADGNVQIKMTAGNSVAMYATCDRLVVLRVVPPEYAEIVYDGPGQPAWDGAAKMGKNGQRVVRVSRLCAISPEKQS